MMLQRRYVSKCLIASIAFDAALLFVVIISHVILFRFWIKWFLFLPRSSLLGNTHNSICWLLSRTPSSFWLWLYAIWQLWSDLSRSPASLRRRWLCSFWQLRSRLPWSSSLLRDLLGLRLPWSTFFLGSIGCSDPSCVSGFGFRGLPGPLFATTSSP